jgi:hypothetical protein
MGSIGLLIGYYSYRGNTLNFSFPVDHIALVVKYWSVRLLRGERFPRVSFLFFLLRNYYNGTAMTTFLFL